MVTRIEGRNGDYIELADNLSELPWFQEIVKSARADLDETPDEFLPAWYLNWRDEH